MKLGVLFKSPTIESLDDFPTDKTSRQREFPIPPSLVKNKAPKAPAPITFLWPWQSLGSGAQLPKELHRRDSWNQPPRVRRNSRIKLGQVLVTYCHLLNVLGRLLHNEQITKIASNFLPQLSRIKRLHHVASCFIPSLSIAELTEDWGR